MPQQRAALLAYAGERGALIVAWYVDAAQSGATDDRPAFQDLLTACRASEPGFAAVLTWSGSRFGRDLLDSQFHRADLRRQGIDVISANPAETAPDGAMGYIIEALFDWKNEQFLDDMARDVRRGLRANVVTGYAPGGTPPRGYKAEAVEVGLRRDGRPKVVAKWVVDAERLVIWYHEPALVENARLQCVPPRGFRLKTSMTGGQQYWPEVWATPALATKRSAGASVAAAWREQLGDGEAGSGRLPRGRAAQVGQVDWGGGSEGVRRGWAAVAMVQ